MYIFYPGEYVIGSALFLLTLFVLKRDLTKLENRRTNDDSLLENEVVNPNLVSDDTSDVGMPNIAYENENDDASHQKIN